jgi:hypothetical protein
MYTQMTNPPRIRTRHMSNESRRSPTVIVAGLIGLALVAALITRTSSAAFSATTDNGGNSFSAAALTLTDDDSASALFTLSNMEPGDSQTACIEVTYAGTVATPSAVRLYSGGYTDVSGPDPGSDGLSDDLNVTVEEGTGATFGSCAGFSPTSTIVATTTLANMSATYTNYATGAGAWTPAGSPETRSYRFTVELDAATPSAEQGASTTNVDFVWEVQS